MSSEREIENDKKADKKYIKMLQVYTYTTTN